MKEFGAGLQRTLEFVNSSSVDATLSNSNACDSQFINKTEYSFCLAVPKILEIGLTNEQSTTTSIGIVGFVNPTVEVKLKLKSFETN